MNGKLVRNKIPEIIAAETGKPVKFRVLTEDEYKDALHKKLDEEVAEFHQSGDVEELVDIYEVIVALAASKGVYDLDRKSMDKQKRRGGFNNRYFLYTDENDEKVERTFWPLKSDKLCNTCYYGVSNYGCRGRGCKGCEMSEKPECSAYSDGSKDCYCASIIEGDPCKYYKEVYNDQP